MATTTTKPINNGTAKKVTIVIPLTRHDSEDYWVAVNGEKYLIKRGEPVEVPDYIAAAIHDSDKMLAEAMAYEAQAQK